MRRAFMNMFPDATVQGSGAMVPSTVDKKPDQNSAQKAAANMKTEVSVFSSFDTSQDGTVDFKEANEGGPKGTSLFERVNKANYNKLADNATQGLSKDAKDNVLASAQKKSGINIAENLQTKFESLLENKFGKVSGLTKKYTAEDGKINGKDTNQVTKDAQSKFDAQVKTAAQNAMASANQELMNKFMDALSEATANQRKEEAEKAGNDKNKNGNYVKENSLEVKANDIQKENLDGVNAKIKETVYSSYDKDKDERVTSNQDEIGSRMTSGFRNNVKIMGGNDEQQKAVLKKLSIPGSNIGEVAKNSFEDAIKDFSENVGSKTFKKGATKEELAAAMNKLNQAAEKAADKAAQKASDKVNNELQQKVNAALAEVLNPQQKASLNTDAGNGGGVDVKLNNDGGGVDPNNGGDAPQVLTATDGTPLVDGQGGVSKTDNGFEKKVVDDKGGTTITKYDQQGNTTSTIRIETETLDDGSSRTTTTEKTPKQGGGEGDITTTTTTVTTSKDKKTETTEIDTDGVRKSKVTQETDAAGDTKVTTETADKVVINGYKVVSGDTCWGIANRLTKDHEGFKVSAKDIMDENKIKDPKKLQIGTKLHITMKKS